MYLTRAICRFNTFSPLLTRCLWHGNKFYGTAQESAKSSSENTPVDPEEFLKLKTEFEALEKRFNELDDKYKRSLAETDNTRKRLLRQISDAKVFAIQGFCKDLLEVSDILEKATSSLTEAEVKRGSTQLQGLFEGLSMTELKLQSVFKHHKLQKVNPTEGEKFDPNVHEAMFTVPVQEGKTPGTVFVVTKVGYMLHDRTLRAALVGVYAES